MSSLPQQPTIETTEGEMPIWRADDWRPAATAPKDGTQILVFVPSFYQGKGGITWALWSRGEWLESSCRRMRDDDVTHWMPMPNPPRKDIR